jgi:arylsulfatase A-like enzyme
VDTPVSLVDVFPTIADVLGIVPPSGLSGQSLLGLIREPETLAEPVFADLSRVYQLRAVISDGWKLIYDTQSPERSALYHLAIDSAEQRNLIDDEPERARALAERLTEHEALQAAQAAKQGGRAVGDDEIEALRELGYVD